MVSRQVRRLGRRTRHQRIAERIIAQLRRDVVAADSLDRKVNRVPGFRSRHIVAEVGLAAGRNRTRKPEIRIRERILLIDLVPDCIGHLIPLDHDIARVFIAGIDISRNGKHGTRSGCRHRGAEIRRFRVAAGIDPIDILFASHQRIRIIGYISETGLAIHMCGQRHKVFRPLFRPFDLIVVSPGDTAPGHDNPIGIGPFRCTDKHGIRTIERLRHIDIDGMLLLFLEFRGVEVNGAGSQGEKSDGNIHK